MNSEEQIFWTFFITTMCAFILQLGRQLYKSKCKEVQICCIRVVRDVESEEKYDELQFQNPNVGNNEVEGEISLTNQN
jgi:hypothetical protein